MINKIELSIKKLFIGITKDVLYQAQRKSDVDKNIRNCVIWMVPIVGALMNINNENKYIRINCVKSLVLFTIVTLVYTVFDLISSSLSLGVIMTWILIALYYYLLSNRKKIVEIFFVDDVILFIHKTVTNL